MSNSNIHAEQEQEACEDSRSFVTLYAYEEEAPIVKTAEEILAEKLAELKGYDYPSNSVADPTWDETGATAYRNVCDEIHKISFMKFPNSAVLVELSKASETLDLSFVGLGEKGCYALAAALQMNAHAQTLILVGNYITPVAAQQIARALADTHQITSLDLSKNQIGKVDMPRTSDTRYSNAVPTKGGSVVDELLGEGSVITHLYLRDNHLTDMDISLFAETLSENVHLQVLDLSSNRIGQLGAAELAKILARNADMRDINLEWNNFGTNGCMNILANGFLNNNTIKTFNMGSCGLEDSCASLLARVMDENAVEEIYIANNRIGPSGAAAIAKGMQTSSSLTVLVLDGNPLGEAGCKSILDVALVGGCQTLTRLDMLNCGCTPETEKRVREENNGTAVIRVSEGRSVTQR